MGTLHTHARDQPKVRDLFIHGGRMRIQIHPAEELILQEAIHLRPPHQEEAVQQNKEEHIHRPIVNQEVIADRLITNRVPAEVHLQVLHPEVVRIALLAVAAAPAEVIPEAAIREVVPVAAVPAVTPVPAAVVAVAVIQAVPARDRVPIHPVVQVEVLHIHQAVADNI